MIPPKLVFGYVMRLGGHDGRAVERPEGRAVEQPRSARLGVDVAREPVIEERLRHLVILDTGADLEAGEQLVHERTLAGLGEAWSERDVAAAMSAGASLADDDAVALALAVGQRDRQPQL
jgi:hypothetical protein